MERVAATLMRIFARRPRHGQTFLRRQSRSPHHQFQRAALSRAVETAAAWPVARRRAYRLRQPDDPQAGQCAGRSSGAEGRRVDRCADPARDVHRQSRRPDGRVDQRSLGFDVAPRRQPAARQSGRQPPAFDGVLPPAQLRRGDRVPADLLGRRTAAALRPRPRRASMSG